ncbi:MAG: GNAT family N-acetyltransferase [Ignavibacteria bacterium]|nr:GNAT family N-acetyltransferase [Ignavibacteria bacterium]
MENTEIINYHPSLKIFFKIINYEWLEKYFTIEKRDEEILSNPEKYILDKGGFILFAIHDGAVCGTVAMIKHNNDVFELAKMAVLKKFRGKKIGEKLALEAIERAKNMGAKKIILDTNRSLTVAVSLYVKLGFIKCGNKEYEETGYERETFRMELVISGQ